MRDADHLKDVVADAEKSWRSRHGKVTPINFRIDRGRSKQVPNRIIIHAMGEYIDDGSGTFLHATDFLVKVGFSAHILVAPDGTETRCREDDEGAYHAKGFNRDSLGLEALVAGNQNYTTFLKAIKTDYVSSVQYEVIVERCREWMCDLKITQVDRHSDVDPDRKVDPGDGFPWVKFLEDIRRA